MTKDELISELCTPRCFGLNQIKSILDGFFNSNVCIPKGVNRHPYADVLHEWAEDTYKRVEYDNNGTFMWFGYPLPIDSSELRIKPSEPVYEWQWEYKDDNTREWIYSKYMTNEEFEKFEYCAIDIAEKAEKTKRIRK